MYNPYDVESRWELSNMDDAHYYNMGTWVDKPKKRLWGVLLSIGIPLILWLGLHLQPFLNN